MAAFVVYVVVAPECVVVSVVVFGLGRGVVVDVIVSAWSQLW